MDVFGVVRVGDVDGNAAYDSASVDVVVQEESGDAGLRFAVDDGPVDGSRPTILRQQGCMEVESAVWRHVPDHFREHPKGNDNLQVGIPSPQCLQKFLIAKPLRLQHGQPLLQGILFHSRCCKRSLMAAYGFIGHGDHSDHVVAAFYQCF